MAFTFVVDLKLVSSNLVYQQADSSCVDLVGRIVTLDVSENETDLRCRECLDDRVGLAMQLWLFRLAAGAHSC